MITILKKNHRFGNINKKKSGYAVLELLFYITFFSILSLVVINSIILMAGSLKETVIQAELVQSGIIMERMSREIRQANSIDVTSTSTDLILNTTSGSDTKIEFKFNSPNIELWENSVKTGNLNSPNITVTELTFSQINTAKSKAVKISLAVKYNNDVENRIVNFYNTIVLRGSY